MKTSLAAVALLVSSAALAQTPATPSPPQPKPAFAGQTKAPPPKTPSKYRVETITDALTGPWALAFLPDGNFLVSERRGNLRTVTRDGKVSEPIAGVPPVKVVAAQSFHDVVLDPNFAQNRYVYFTYFAPPKGEAAKEWPIEHYYNDVWNKSLAERRVLDLGEETVARAKLSADNRRLESLDILIQAHVERRIVFARDGTMLVTGADAFRLYDSDLDSIEGRVFTDNPDVRRNFTGRVIRINSDGTIPKDNPWLGRATVARETYAHGFKEPDGRKNVPVGSGKTSEPGVDEPIYYWVPSIAPSGMAFYTGNLFPEWKGNLFVGAMAGKRLVRLVLDGENVVAEEGLLTELDSRIREVRQGPDGALYVLAGDSLVRIMRAK